MPPPNRLLPARRTLHPRPKPAAELALVVAQLRGEDQPSADLALKVAQLRGGDQGHSRWLLGTSGNGPKRNPSRDTNDEADGNPEKRSIASAPERDPNRRDKQCSRHSSGYYYNCGSERTPPAAEIMNSWNSDRSCDCQCHGPSE